MVGCLVRCFAPPGGFARAEPGGAGFRRPAAAVQLNSLAPDRVGGSVMLTSAIVFGMVWVAAGFTWDYISSRRTSE